MGNERRIAWIAFLVLTCFGPGLFLEGQEEAKEKAGEVAGSDRVAEIIRTYEGRGTLADGSAPTPPEEALQGFRVREGFEIELVASEPEVEQPLHISWDEKGRMWVTQYRQYQFPAGLKIVEYDDHLRAQFDKVPEPPPHGTPGADKITVFEDTDGDGRYDSHRDVITGLNIATSCVTGAGGIWVSNPPYLLFYPDADGDAEPDTDPIVKLSGFGIEDTHSVMNSLKWGPDGWLYGVNGSTTTGSVENPATGELVEWQGQMVWRFHPDTEQFEIYAEGGGNTFSLEIDSAGRVFSGTNNGNTRGMYYPRGSYGKKSWGKHGPLTNPYAFGYIGHMKHEGDERRFAQAFCIYEGGLYPESWDGKIIAANSLHNIVWASEVLPDGSTFRTVDEEPLLETDDRWFRPVFCGVGPDGCVYLADWYDSRLSHVRPVDDWHKTSGRIYRVKPVGSNPKVTHGDLAEVSAEDRGEVIVDDPNWMVRKRALLEESWSGEGEAASAGASGLLHAALVEQGREEEAAQWRVREFAALPSEAGPKDADPSLRAEWAASAKYRDAGSALSIVEALLSHEEDLADPHQPLLLWWVIEAHAESGRDAIDSLLAKPATWEHALFRETIPHRLMKRYAMVGGEANWASCAGLLERAPDEAMRSGLLEALQASFAGAPVPEDLPEALVAALDEYARSLDETGLVARVKSGDETALPEARKAVLDSSLPLGVRTELIRQLADRGDAGAVPSLLRILSLDQNSALKRVALQALGRFDDPKIAETILSRYGRTLPAEHGVRATAERVLASRPGWAMLMLDKVDEAVVKSRQVSPGVVPLLLGHDDETIDARVAEHWPMVVAGAAGIDYAAESERIAAVLAGGEGDADRGQVLYATRCGTCHELFGEGKQIGPALTGYERHNLDFWLAGILNPSLELREGYLNYIVTMTDGSKAGGMIVERGPRTIVLKDAAGETTEIARAAIESLEASPISLMPPGLLVGLDDRQVRDFFAYLMRDQ